MNAKTVTASAVDQCELCGYQSDGTAADRLRHLRGTHPAYAKGVLLRVVAPIVFLPEVLGLGVLHAPQWAFVVAFISCFGLLFAGKQISRRARKKAGARPVPPIRRLLRDGGLGIVAFLPIVILVILATSR